MKCSNDKSVVFDSESHTYTKGKNKLISVTTFISQFKNKFDSDFWSKKIALRDKKTQEEVLSEWKEKAFRSTEIGTAIHKIFEDYTFKNYAIINDNFVFEEPVLNSEYLIEYNSKKTIAISFIKDFFVTSRLMPLFSEYIVYNDFLAGQIDNVSIDRKGNLYILDFKTNKEISYNSYGKKMLNEFSFLDDCSYYHYCLQLSVYKAIIKEPIKKMYLVHITEESYCLIECEDIIKKNNINLDLLKNN
jgi:ATP-dependent exoDNAse (exonuclease V) beta subunit